MQNRSRTDHIKAGQRWYNERVDQHAVVLGRNHVGGIVLQYEDGDLVEWNRRVGRGPGVEAWMIYLPAPREIEERRPTLDGACPVDEHVFLTEPLTLPEAESRSLRCGKCGVEFLALVGDAGQGLAVYDRLRETCPGCGEEIPPGVQHRWVGDIAVCESCDERLDAGVSVTTLVNGFDAVQTRLSQFEAEHSH